MDAAAAAPSRSRGAPDAGPSKSSEPLPLATQSIKACRRAAAKASPSDGERRAPVEWTSERLEAVYRHLQLHHVERNGEPPNLEQLTIELGEVMRLRERG